MSSATLLGSLAFTIVTPFFTTRSASEGYGQAPAAPEAWPPHPSSRRAAASARRPRRWRVAIVKSISLGAQFTEAEAADQVVIDQPGRLHERVADRRPDEVRPARDQVLAQGD